MSHDSISHVSKPTLEAAESGDSTLATDFWPDRCGVIGRTFARTSA